MEAQVFNQQVKPETNNSSKLLVTQTKELFFNHNK
jgi:hypothetical protein